MSNVSEMQREIVHSTKMFTSALGSVQENFILKNGNSPVHMSASTTACAVLLIVSDLRNIHWFGCYVRQHEMFRVCLISVPPHSA